MQRRTEYTLVALLMGVAVFFALFHLTESPPVWYDEGIYIQAAANLAAYGHMGMELAPGQFSSSAHITVGYPLIYPLALVFKVFGVSVFAARLLMVAFLLAFTIASYLLVRRLFGVGSALAALLLLVSFPPLYGNGKSVLGEVPGLLFLILGLIAAQRAVALRSLNAFALTGLCIGLSVATKPLFVLVIPAFLIALFLARSTFIVSIKEFVTAAVAALVPILAWLVTQFGKTDSAGEVFGFYANPYGIQTLAATIAQNALHLVTDATPLYLSLMLAVWAIALLVRRRARESISFGEYAAFAFSILVVLAYLRTAGWYRYLFEAQVIAILFFPHALKTLLAIFAKHFSSLNEQTKKSTYALVLTGLFAFGVYGLCFGSWAADAYASRKTAFWETYFSDSSPANTFFFYNTPEVALFAFGRTYFQYLIPAGGAIGAESLAVLRAGIPDVVILETDALSGAKDDIGQYAPFQTAYKYTILTRSSR